jgi:hypothetical protein
MSEIGDWAQAAALLTGESSHRHRREPGCGVEQAQAAQFDVDGRRDGERRSVSPLG